MSSPSISFILVCPTCGKKYQGNPEKPTARYKCPADQTELVRPPAPPAAAPSQESLEDQTTQRMTQETVPQEPPPDTTESRITQPIAPPKMSSGPTDSPDDDQATRVMYSDSSSRLITNDPQPDEDKTRVLGSPTFAPSHPSKATLDYSATVAHTVTPTIRDERRSVIAMIQGGSNTCAAASLLKDKYEVVGKLGQGGVGEVLKVLDRDLKREVAMKMLLKQERGVSEDSLIRFIEEAQATGQLEHPNIVPVHDLGIDPDGRVYFTLKYVQGVPLKKVIKGRADNSALEEGAGFYRERYTPLRMIEILVSMCQAVAYAHSKGIIHRDLKPDNVMLGKYGEVLVMDWGLAKVLGAKKTKKQENERDTVRISTSRAEDQSQSTMEGSIAGTPAYMSPEQAAGKISELDQRTDIYALGAILYEILSGMPPYHGAGALTLVKQVVDGPPPPLETGSHGFNPVPRELKAICDRAMARKPQDRYATASLLRDDLQAYLENQPVSAAPDSPLQRAAKWVRRNRRQVQTSAISAAVVLAVIFGGWFAWRQWTIHSLLSDATAKLDYARGSYKTALSSQRRPDNDPYAAQLSASAQGENARIFRNAVNAATDPLRRVLDISPQNSRARLLLAESYMELWRLAIAEDNIELARATRADVERNAPEPNPFAAELAGFGTLALSFDPPDTESFLFRFETLRAKDGSDNDLPARLIPVPFNPNTNKIDQAFIDAERTRIANGVALPVEKHSVFNLQPTAAGVLGEGAVNLAQLAPGSYMLLLRAPGHAEVRVPFRMPRGGKVNRKIELPKDEEMPPGFFYMAGGEVIVGGTTAGAPAPHTINLPPSFIYHDEISMGEYAQFLKELTRTGRAAEARQRLPKDFGKNLAVMSPTGDLMPTDRGDPAEFAKSPVRGVSFNDAIAYVGWRSKVDGLAYRLPKDWEWEGACRGADGRTYSWGNQPGKGLAVVTQGYGDSGTNMSWKWENYKDESPWGIHNLAGGAAEWTMSKYDPGAKPSDPVYGQMAIRGNAWALPPTGLECAFRTSGQPDYFHPTIGFRLALDYPVKRIGPALEGAAAMVHGH
ncbi:MAG: serine/threonine protein kinase [Acidobacteriales bacterium]|nr:serine/threonine protein kinase [Terriglobales bacterium]